MHMTNVLKRLSPHLLFNICQNHSKRERHWVSESLPSVTHCKYNTNRFYCICNVQWCSGTTNHCITKVKLVAWHNFQCPGSNTSIETLAVNAVWLLFPHCTGNVLPMPLLQAVSLNFFRDVQSYQVQNDAFPLNIAAAINNQSIQCCSSGRLLVFIHSSKTCLAFQCDCSLTVWVLVSVAPNGSSDNTITNEFPFFCDCSLMAKFLTTWPLCTLPSCNFAG